MPKVVDGKAADKVDILFPGLVPDLGTFPFGKDNRETSISSGNVFFCKLDDIFTHQFF